MIPNPEVTSDEQATGSHFPPRRRKILGDSNEQSSPDRPQTGTFFPRA